MNFSVPFPGSRNARDAQTVGQEKTDDRRGHEDKRRRQEVVPSIEIHPSRASSKIQNSSHYLSSKLHILRCVSFQFHSMFDVSWGELFVVGAVGATLAGKRDLPNACRFIGSQIGRVVGLLQGARARADRFTAQNELRQLQNELRSGLRELDQVKTELGVAVSMGRTLGATTASANRMSVPSDTISSPSRIAPSTVRSSTQIPPMVTATATATSASNTFSPPLPSPATDSSIAYETELPPAIQSERATMEEEWEKQGIGFRSRAEMGSGISGGIPSNDSNTSGDAWTGSELLENLIKQNLIFDQYDRVVGEQDDEMQQRIEKVKAKRLQENPKKEE
jgi:Sec-independent protein translocase protein TatA